MTGEISQGGLPWQEDLDHTAADDAAHRTAAPSPVTEHVADRIRDIFDGLVEPGFVAEATDLADGQGGAANEAAALQQFPDVGTDDL